MHARTRFSRLKQLSLLRITLLSMGMFDEIITGFTIVGLPLLRDQLGLSYTQIGLLFVVQSFASILLDPLLNLLTDRGSKCFWILGGLLILALSFILRANTHSFIVLLLAFGVLFPADEMAVGLSQAALIELNPTQETQVMTRYELLSSIGDFLGPLLVTALVSFSVGWTGLCWLAASIWLVLAIVISTQRFPRVSVTEDDEPTSFMTLLGRLRSALRDPILLRWVALAAIPTMVDEVFLGFIALYLRDVLHVNQATIGLIVAIHTFGALLGLFLLDRFLLKRSTPRQLLLWLSLLVLVGMICLLSIHVVWVVTLALFIIGLGASGWYPTANGQAYARMPGHASIVRSVMSLFVAADVAIPGIVSLIADHYGLLAGLSFLGLAPVLMLLLLIGL